MIQMGMAEEEARKMANGKPPEALRRWAK